MEEDMIGKSCNRCTSAKTLHEDKIGISNGNRRLNHVDESWKQARPLATTPQHAQPLPLQADGDPFLSLPLLEMIPDDL